ncbi:aldose epimerase family protein [Sedimentitalea todarodis]|nr:aldose epimerase family protein [Sedimentitalea todarodis]
MTYQTPYPFGQLPGGETVFKVDIAGQEMRASVLTYGATLQALHIDGLSPSMVLGLPSLQDYLLQPIYLGATVGRCANRIADGRFALGGITYQLDQNFQKRHTLHGGRIGTAQLNLRVSDVAADSVQLAIDLPDGHMGFPGALRVKATFRILVGPTLELEITATTDAPTICNLAHHGYFNLGGDRTILDHHLFNPAQTYQTTDMSLIPNHEPTSVEGTRYDFRQPRRLADVIDTGAIDNNFCFTHQRGDIALLSRLHSPGAGVSMEIHSTERGLQVYDGVRTDLVVLKREGWPSHAGIASEPQNWPDAMNNPLAPASALHPGETYRQLSRFTFCE